MSAIKSDKTLFKVLDFRIADALNEICERVSQGETIRSICNDSHMPSLGAFEAWVTKHPDSHAQYIRARESQGNRIFDKIHDLADEFSDKNWKYLDKRINTLKWVAGKLNSAYSDAPTAIVDQSQTVYVNSLQDAQAEKVNRLMLAAKQRQLPAKPDDDIIDVAPL